LDADGNWQEVEINDEIRGVMDRMLASEEEIEAHQAVRESRDLAERLKKQGIPDAMVERYRDLVEESAEKAKTKLFRKLMSELKDEKRTELAGYPFVRDITSGAMRSRGRYSPSRAWCMVYNKSQREGALDSLVQFETN
jgi:hypothetical protein